MRVQVVKKPTVISTFAGCGGSSLGYRLAGFSELLAVEWDDNAVETFRLNFPDVPVYHGDIAKLTGAQCMRLAGGISQGELDVLDGSPPCQGFPEAFHWRGTKGESKERIGNSVPPNLMRAIAEHIRKEMLSK